MPKLADLKNGDEISGVFVIQQVEMRHFADKPGRYLRVRLSDDSGIMTGVCFDPDLLPFTIKKGMKIAIQGAKVTEFREELRLKFLPGSIHKIAEGVSE